MKRHAFTLIELLIVVAIIAILAAIAIPNFLEAQVRAKISRAKNDMRTMDVGLNSYLVDTNNFPYPKIAFIAPNGPMASYYIPWCTELTTPIAYLASVSFDDPFGGKNPWFDANATWGMSTRRIIPYSYINYAGTTYDVYMSSAPPPLPRRKAFCISSQGPDRWPSFIGWGVCKDDIGQTPFIIVPFNKWNTVYDSTNGTMSSGDIGRFGGDIQGPPL